MSKVEKWTDAEIEAALREGREEAALRAHFGDGLYDELTSLSRAPLRTQRSDQPKVFLLPGIMGSKLSVREADGGSDLIWIDPYSLRYSLDKLRWPQDPDPVFGSGVLSSAYLRMKFRLRWMGHDVEYLPYDWRSGIHQTGETVLEQIRATGGPVNLVAHSMGGLVARKVAAIAEPGEIKTVVTIGTPNHGSYSPVTAMRLTHEYVRLLGRLAEDMEPKDVVERYLSRYPGLLEMLPSPDKRPGEDFFDADWWPGRGGVVPKAEFLQAAHSAATSLPPPDDRFFQIVGIGQDTLISSEKKQGRLIYRRSPDGDGTVPRDLAEMDGVKERFYYEGGHAWLCNRLDIIRATDDLFRSGRTNRLRTDLPDIETRSMASVTEASLRSAASRNIPKADDLDAFTEDRLAGAFAGADPDPDLDEDLPAPSATVGEVVRTVSRDDAALTGPRTYSFLMTRQQRRRLSVNVLHGNLLDVPAEAYVLGVFEGLQSLGGAVGAVDAALGGALSELVEDNQITGREGEVTLIPTPRYVMRTGCIAVVGLGRAGEPEAVKNAIRLAGRNLVRSLCISKIGSIATVLMGSRTNLNGAETFRALFQGIFESLKQNDPEQHFSRITVCEMREDAWQELEGQLANTFSRFGELDCEIVLNIDKVTAPQVVRAAASAARTERHQPDILDVRGEMIAETDGDYLQLEINFIAGSGKGHWGGGRTVEVPRSLKKIKLGDLDAITEELSGLTSDRDIGGLASDLRDLIFDEVARDRLYLDPDTALVVINSPWASRVPWELLHSDNVPIALRGGISRRYLPDARVVSRPNARRSVRDSRRDRLLMVSDPLDDLFHARKEAEKVREILTQNFGRYELDELASSAATVEALKAKLSPDLGEPSVDLLHYAGHAFFDPEDRSRSGLILSGDETLDGSAIAMLPDIPRFVFLNACESSRVRKPRARDETALETADYVRRNIGLAEMFITRGVSTMLGTIWPVDDRDAGIFAAEFYRAAATEDIGAAVLKARRALAAKESPSWLNYIHYGEPSSLL